MIITIYGIIVFHLISWIALNTKSLIKVSKENKNMVAFTYLAIPTRHEVTC